MTAAPTILEAMEHPGLWGPWFRNPESWAPWRAFLAALFGLPLSADELALYQQCTGRETPPPGGCNEAWLIVGRRGGKSMILALIACYLAVFRNWQPYLSLGEVGTIKVLATDRRQARVIHRYARALLTEVPALDALVERDSDDEIALNSNGCSIVIEVQSATFRSVRGHTILAALCDEAAFWRNNETSANPDEEVFAALRPAMATIPQSMLLCASSPYARRGVLWAAYKRHYGQADAPALVWKAATLVTNPSVPERVITEAFEDDPASAAAEYGAEFRTDIESFISREAVDAAVPPGLAEMPYNQAFQYTAFCDPAGGSGQDSYSLAISHSEVAELGGTERVFLDCVREGRPPFSPEAVTQEFAETLLAYGCTTVIGDKYGGEFPRELFSKCGVTYLPAEKPKSDLYREMLPLLNSGRVELLDNPKLISQLCGLERRTARGGRDSIDHSPGGHDDVCNAVAGAVVHAAGVNNDLSIWIRLAS